MTTTITAEDLAKLRELAKKATSGPWLHRHDPGNPVGVQHGVKLPGEFGAWVCDCLDNADKSTDGGLAGERNAAFIAAFNPEMARALLDQLEAANKDAARYRWLLDNYATGDGYTHIDNALNYGEPEKLSSAIDAEIAIATQGEING